ncbi:sugar nucleotide-binding protein [Magnetospirillum sp. SS-4]|uniref:SDR family oxidoreductase n=1 Tax=Magnetospirillum sp. SS-4 TaxID=2681465 RepID=UPI001384F3D4|nr:sugar nucleotide-binding protein [Magnetospirillum sp. SS-4]CAA7614471.1 putative dTDP-4-dehydrorhamnose reductase [Magnetospirillum sp. SS-4]
MSKLVILGASSSVGRHLWNHLGPERAIGTYRANPIAGGRPFDSVTQRATDILRPGEASHAAILLADPQPDSCIKDPEASRRLNVTAMTRLCQDLWALGITPIFASTEFVFDGAGGEYTEEDEARPILLYGRQKKEVEDFLACSGRPHVILRFAKVYGDRPGDGTIFTVWAAQLLSGTRTMRCASDQAFSPVFVGDVGDAIVRAAERNLAGLFHLSGNHRFNRLELLEMTIAAIRRRRPLDLEIQPCSIDDFNLPEPRPKDVSMRSDKLAAAAGLVFADTEAKVDRIVADTLG